MAGIPYLTARASAERFAKLKRKHPHGLTYRMFLLVQSALAEPPKSVQDTADPIGHRRKTKRAEPPKTALEAADLIRQRRETATNENIAAANALGENWHLVSEALRSAYANPPQIAGSLAYIVFADYQLRQGHQTADQVLLSAEAKLPPVKERGARRGSRT
jgi:hypothetical protein